MASLDILQLNFLIFSPIHGRMADASTRVYEFDIVLRGQDVYKSAWIPLTDKMHKCTLRENNKHDKYAVNHRPL